MTHTGQTCVFSTLHLWSPWVRFVHIPFSSLLFNVVIGSIWFGGLHVIGCCSFSSWSLSTCCLCGAAEGCQAVVCRALCWHGQSKTHLMVEEQPLHPWRACYYRIFLVQFAKKHLGTITMFHDAFYYEFVEGNLTFWNQFCSQKDKMLWMK